MKVLLGFNKPDISGYKNLGIRKNLDDEVEDGQSEEIFASDSIDFVQKSEMRAYLDGLCKKLKQGGTLCVTGTDLMSLVEKLYVLELSVDDFYLLTRGDELSPTKFVHATMNNISSALSEHINVIKKSYEGHKFVIVGVKK